MIDIELAALTAAGCECTSCGRRVYGPHVALRVRDHGSGIPPALLLLRVFDPFFTTKDVGKGTGLGLAMVHSLVHQAGGHVLVTSAPGHGTTFEVLLPVTTPPPPADPPPTAADACLSGGDGSSAAAALP